MLAATRRGGAPATEDTAPVASVTSAPSAAVAATAVEPGDDDDDDDDDDDGGGIEAQESMGVPVSHEYVDIFSVHLPR
jgi:hypothetical protein